MTIFCLNLYDILFHDFRYLNHKNRNLRIVSIPQTIAVFLAGFFFENKSRVGKGVEVKDDVYFAIYAQQQHLWD